MESPREKPKYHHGDLRAALLAAAEAELEQHGIEGFSLRSVAKRAGVSHAAPAHHFGDAGGLVTALAAEGFRQFVATMDRFERRADHAALEAAGLGYVAFAEERPALFRLIFSSSRPDFDDPELAEAADRAFDHLVARVEALGGGTEDVAAVWAMAHGLSDLLAAGRLKQIALLPEDRREAMILALLRRASPGAKRR